MATLFEFHDHLAGAQIVAGPGIAKGAKNNAWIYLQDVMPTTLELAGLDKPKHVEFNSLLPLLRGETKKSPYNALYGAYLAVQRSVTEGDYKLILYPKIKRARLYHLQDDPLEMKDLAGSTESKPIIKRLFARLLVLQKETGDELDLQSVYGEP